MYWVDKAFEAACINASLFVSLALVCAIASFRAFLRRQPEQEIEKWLFPLFAAGYIGCFFFLDANAVRTLKEGRISGWFYWWAVSLTIVFVITNLMGAALFFRAMYLRDWIFFRRIKLVKTSRKSQEAQATSLVPKGKE